MQHVSSIIKKSFLGATVVLLISFFPATSISYADSTCTAPSGPGSSHPTGSSAGTYTFNCDSGLWENGHYAMDPATGVISPTYSIVYTYNNTTGKWDSSQWLYVASDGAYEQQTVSVSQPPAGATTVGGPVAITPSTNTGSSSTGNGASTLSSADPSSAAAASSVSGTGADSQNSINNGLAVNNSTTNNNTLGMSNTIGSIANSGDAFVIGNTTAGSAASGDASALANIANLLQSTSNVFGPNTATFVSNINGDVNGDFMFDPSAIIANTGANSQNSTNGNLQVNTNNANNTNAQITNNLDLTANSGNATVAQNTTAGDATSGNATAVADLMNLINSTVTSGQSFVGVVNINGNLNGDILLPQGLIDQLIASSGANSTNGVNNTATDNSTTTNNTTTGIANNINSAAQTGNATVSKNTTGGNATTGTAGTNVTLLNLTGSNTIGKNNILVFVNVLGHWVGMIVDAPQGSTSASLGGGISNTGANSSNGVNNSADINTSNTTNNSLGITNNVNVSAQSGDANVSQNTTGGNAKSGNASTAVNVLNIAGSNLNLSDWFGVLFINVFGNWTGSFGVNTSAGDPVITATPAQTTSTGSGSTPTTSPAPSSPIKQFASFVAHGSGSASGTSSDTSTMAINNSVLTASVLGSHTAQNTAKTLPTPDTKAHADFTLPIIGASIAFLMLAGERVVAIRKSHKV